MFLELLCSSLQRDRLAVSTSLGAEPPPCQLSQRLALWRPCCSFPLASMLPASLRVVRRLAQSVAQGYLELTVILLSQPPTCWDKSHHHMPVTFLSLNFTHQSFLILTDFHVFLSGNIKRILKKTKDRITLMRRPLNTCTIKEMPPSRVR